MLDEVPAADELDALRQRLSRLKAALNAQSRSAETASSSAADAASEKTGNVAGGAAPAVAAPRAGGIEHAHAGTAPPQDAAPPDAASARAVEIPAQPDPAAVSTHEGFGPANAEAGDAPTAPLLRASGMPERKGEQPRQQPNPALMADASATPEKMEEAAGTSPDTEETGDEGDEGTAKGRDSLQDVALLLKLVSRPDSVLPPQERALALDLLSQRLHAIGASMRAATVERVCAMENPPQRLLEALLDVVTDEERQTLLLRARLPEGLQMQLAASRNVAVQALLARRPRLSACVTWLLVETAPEDVLLALLRNEGAVLDEQAWEMLHERIGESERLGAALAARGDLPLRLVPIVFWQVSSAVRRQLLRRFSSESEMLSDLLRVSGLRLLSREHFLRLLHVALGMLAEGGSREAAELLAAESGLHAPLLQRVMRDDGGEALAVLMKAHGSISTDFRALLDLLRQQRRGGRWPFLEQPEEVMGLHDGLSVNRARLILQYWEWHSRGEGPFATAADDAA